MTTAQSLPRNEEFSVADLEKLMESIENDNQASVQPPPAPVIPNATAPAVIAPIPVATAPAVVTPLTGTVEKKNPLKTFVEGEQLRRDVYIDPNDLDKAYIEHADLYVVYAVAASKAGMQYQKMKAAFDVLESKLYVEHREAMEREVADALAADPKAKVKAPTEAAVDAKMKADPRWWAGKSRLIEAEGIYEVAKHATSAFSQRRDMLIQVGSDRRQDRAGQLRLNDPKGRQEQVLEQLAGQTK